MKQLGKEATMGHILYTDVYGSDVDVEIRPEQPLARLLAQLRKQNKEVTLSWKHV